MNDKNKIMIVAALGVVMIGVGAFNFMGGSKPEPAPTSTKKAEPKAENTGQTEGGQETVATGTGTATEGTETIDPVTGKPVANNGNPNPEGNPAITPGNEVSVLVDPEAVRVARLNLRDPFNGARWDPLTDIQPVSNPVTSPTPKPATTVRRPRPMGNGRITIPPFDPTGQGGLNPIGDGAPLGQGQMPNYDDVPYKVNGIVSGANSAAIVTDGQGKQRIVRVGANLDPDTKVLGVENGKMIVRYRGKVKTVSINDAGADKSGTKPPQNQ